MWLKDVWNQVRKSVYDTSPRKIQEKLSREVENGRKHKRKNVDNFPLILAAVCTQNNDAEIFSTSHISSESGSSDTDEMVTEENEVIKWRFEGQDWVRDTDSTWSPPASNTSTVNKIEDDDDRESHEVLDINADLVSAPTVRILAQSDSGANRIVTNDLRCLINVKNIAPYPMSGVNVNDPAAIVCTKVGYMPLVAKDGQQILAKTYYSNSVDGTIISPTALVSQYQKCYTGWLQKSDCDKNLGELILIGKDGYGDLVFDIVSKNDLWYHVANNGQVNETRDYRPTIRYLSKAATFELWHQRTGHAGRTCLTNLHKHAEGVPPLSGNAFWRCPSCMSGKLCTKRPVGKLSKQRRRQMKKQGVNSVDHEEDIDPDSLDDIVPGEPGQHFHMDFGFVRGTKFKTTDAEGRTITSIDGKNSYLIIVDRCTRFTWIFLSVSKHPPIEAARMILQKFRSKNLHRTVRVDQGGELGRSSAFQEMIGTEKFVLEPTGSDASSQNGISERPNRTFGQMMRCILHSAELGPEYWSHALIHAVYIKNRITHTKLNMTPYQKFTGRKPDLTNLKIFGSKVYAKKPGNRPAKLDHHTSSGIYLGDTATDKNVKFIDDKSGKIKIGTHVLFDEAHMTTPAGKAPLAAQTLQRLGYSNKEYPSELPRHTNKNMNTLQIVKMSPNIRTPNRATKDSIGYDIHSASDTNILIEAGKAVVIPTGLKIKPPSGTYARIAPRSGLAVKRNLHVMAGVIDPDYTGELQVVLYNFGQDQQTIIRDDKIAQIILENAETPDIKEISELDPTERGQNGFGSSDKIYSKKDTYCTSSNLNANSRINDNDISMDTIRPPAAAAAKLQSDIQTVFDMPYSLTLDSSPYDFHTHRVIMPRKNDDDFLGMKLEMCDKRTLPKLIDCNKGMSAIKIPKWRSELRNGYVTTINNIPVKDVDSIRRLIHKARCFTPQSPIKIGFSTIDQVAIHPQYGIPQLYHDQLNIIGKHLFEIRNEPQWNKEVDDAIIYPEKPKILSATAREEWLRNINVHACIKVQALKRRKKLTRRILKQQEDWHDWQLSEFKQLDQFYSQNTFGEPTACPQGANLLPLLWTYLIKDDGTKKARCCCNGSAKMRGTVTLAETYAASLEQTGARIFWAATALNNFITIGADASNAFAEAPPPKAQLYVRIDNQYREWYKSKYPNRAPIPKDFVLPVYGALQGHPESPRLWATLIDKIIRKLNLQPCSHERCLYYTTNYNGTGQIVLFLRQVDDFAVSCNSEKLATQVIEDINSQMKINVKKLGSISRFNGMDVSQSRYYIKIFNKTYIEKICVHHKWLQREKHSIAINPIPMYNDAQYQRKLEQTEPAMDITRLEKDMGFGYRQAIGELIYAMVTCRPDISYAVLKLSQYSTRPNTIHFEAVKNVYRYLNRTKDDGIYYWRTTPRLDLPNNPLPPLGPHNNYDSTCKQRLDSNPSELKTAVDSDYAGDTSHRKSVSGMIFKMAGGTIFYKTKYQTTIAMSSTEAEFTAAAEAGKYILYVRSILEEIGIPQYNATVLYEDNQGALLMANAQQPTKRTRHMDIKTFKLQEWVEQDLIVLEHINTADNFADVLTKAQGKSLFYRHKDFIMGAIIPAYLNHTTLTNDAHNM